MRLVFRRASMAGSILPGRRSGGGHKMVQLLYDDIEDEAYDVVFIIR